MATVTVGANLLPIRSTEARTLSLALQEFIRKTQLIAEDLGAAKTLYAVQGDARVFRKAGAPATNTAADSPGQDLCFVVDTTNNDLYLIHGWSSSTSFTATKILD